MKCVFQMKLIFNKLSRKITIIKTSLNKEWKISKLKNSRKKIFWIYIFRFIGCFLLKFEFKTRVKMIYVLRHFWHISFLSVNEKKVFPEWEGKIRDISRENSQNYKHSKSSFLGYYLPNCLWKSTNSEVWGFNIPVKKPNIMDSFYSLE